MLPRLEKTHASSGFTLIELLVVVSIISLLSSIVLVAVDTARERARLTAIKANIRTLFTEAELYYSSNNSYVPSAFSGACGSAGGFLENIQAEDAIEQISTLGRISASTGNFYCNIQPSTWSLALDISNLTKSDEVLCASTIDGRIITFENSNDTAPENFVISNQCATPW
jgi:prepilin-type N-terminal cleavage/methylation domain-containing protein